MATDFDFIVTPGDFIEEWLEDNDLSQAEFARRLGCSPKHVSQVIHKGDAVTTDFANRLERVTRVPASRWLQLEAFYRSECERLALEQDAARVKEVLETVPLAEIRKLGYAKATMRHPGRVAMEMFAFFRVGTLDALAAALQPPKKVAFRLGSRVEWASTLTWLRLVEIEASRIDLENEFDRDALRKLLPQLRALTTMEADDFGAKLADMMGEVGVRLIYVAYVPKSGTYGASRWFDGSPLIALSAHRKSDHQFWFTFFHEVGHVLNHELTNRGFVAGDWDEDPMEQEANEFARDFLIPVGEASRLTSLRTHDDVRSFAAELGISPGIIVGRLQRDELWTYSQGATLIRGLHIVDGQ